MQSTTQTARERVTAVAESNGWTAHLNDPYRSEWRKGDMYVFAGWDQIGQVTLAQTDLRLIRGRGRAERLIEDLSR